MAAITDLPALWRDRLRPASFRGIPFHVEVGGSASGRRVALHEFPKRNQPYSEDMGRRARRFHLQAYIIVTPEETDYVPQRDALIDALEADGPDWLVLPTDGDHYVMCEAFRWDEARERGGFVAFDMVFVERGSPVVYDVQPNTTMQLYQAAQEFSNAIPSWLDETISGQGSLLDDSIEAFRQMFPRGGVP